MISLSILYVDEDSVYVFHVKWKHYRDLICFFQTRPDPLLVNGLLGVHFLIM
jgi:hypothetical protein